MSNRKNNYINTELAKKIEEWKKVLSKYSHLADLPTEEARIEPNFKEHGPYKPRGYDSVEVTIGMLETLLRNESFFDSETGELDDSKKKEYQQCCYNVNDQFINTRVNLDLEVSKAKARRLEKEKAPIPKFEFDNEDIRNVFKDILSFSPKIIKEINPYFERKKVSDFWYLEEDEIKLRDQLLAAWEQDIIVGKPPQIPEGDIDEFPNIDRAILLSGSPGDLASYYAQNSGTLSQREKNCLQYRAQNILYLKALGKENHKYKQPSILGVKVDQKNPNKVSLTGFEGMYEHQETGNGCWSCSYAMLLKSKGIDINQFMVRSFRPDVVIDDVPKSNNTVQGLLTDMPFSPMELADLAGRLMPNTAMRSISFSDAPAKKDKADIENYFREAIIASLKKGNPVSLSSKGHFITIVGIDGDNLQVLNSLNTEESGFLETKSLSKLVGKGELSITWLEDISENKLPPEYNGVINYSENFLLNETGGEGLSIEGGSFRFGKDFGKTQVQQSIYVPQKLSNPEALLEKPEELKKVTRAAVKKAANRSVPKSPTKSATSNKNIAGRTVSKPATKPTTSATKNKSASSKPFLESIFDNRNMNNVNELVGLLKKINNSNLQGEELKSVNSQLVNVLLRPVVDKSLFRMCDAIGYTESDEIQAFIISNEDEFFKEYKNNPKVQEAIIANINSIKNLDSLSERRSAIEKMDEFSDAILESMDTGIVKTIEAVKPAIKNVEPVKPVVKEVTQSEIKKEQPKDAIFPIDKPEDVARRKFENPNLTEIGKIREENLYNLRNIIYKANHAKELGDNALADPEGAIKLAFAKLLTDETIINSCIAAGLDDNSTLEQLKFANKDEMFNEIRKSEIFKITYKAQDNLIKALESDSFEDANGMARRMASDFFTSFGREQEAKSKKESVEKSNKITTFDADIFNSELDIIAKQLKKVKPATNNTKALSACITDLKKQFSDKKPITINDADKENMVKKFNEVSKTLKSFRWDGKSPLSEKAQQEFKIMRRIENAIKLSTPFNDPKDKKQRAYTAREREQYKIAEKLLSCKAQKLMESKNPSDIRKGIAMLANNKIHDEAHKAILQDEAFKTMTSPVGKEMSELTKLLKTDNTKFMKEYERVQGVLSPKEEVIPSTNVLG